MNVYLYQNNTEKILKNIYIGEYGWKPWSNTVAYYPLKEDVLDHSWNWVTLTNTQYLSKQSLWYSWVASQWIAYSYIELWFTNQDAKFISMWVKVNSSSWNTEVWTLYKYGMSEYSPSHYDNSSISNKFYLFTNSSYYVWATSNWLTFNEWHHITIWYDWSKVVISKDWVQETLYNWSWYDFWNQVVLCWIWSRGNANYTLSECIVETVARTAQEISDYYNLTKANYWL